VPPEPASALGFQDCLDDEKAKLAVEYSQEKSQQLPWQFDAAD
jgi:hypothetical protein